MIRFLITALIIGFITWLAVTYIPLPQPIRAVIIGIVAIGLLIYGLRVLGVVNL